MLRSTESIQLKEYGNAYDNSKDIEDTKRN